MKRPGIDAITLDPSIEIERFASFDFPTRRFIAYALSHVPASAGGTDDDRLPGGNLPPPFMVSDPEAAERRSAYSAIVRLRACSAAGEIGQRERRLAFCDVLAMALVDLRWRRLTAIAPFLFCYERLVGAHWRELLPLCWKEAVYQRRRRGAVQLPLDRRLRENRTVPNLLDRDPPPSFFPTLADADAIDSPLLANL